MVEFYSKSAKLELYLIPERQDTENYVPMLSLVPSLPNVQGRPQAGQHRFDYEKRITIKLEPTDIAFLIDVTTMFIRAPQTLPHIFIAYKGRQRENQPDIWEYVSLRSTNAGQKIMAVAYNQTQNTLFLSIRAGNNNVSYPLHMIAGPLRDAITVLANTYYGRLFETHLDRRIQQRREQNEQQQPAGEVPNEVAAQNTKQQSVQQPSQQDQADAGAVI